jgi:hypothetical protein
VDGNEESRKALEAALARDFRRYHVRAQAQRLVGGAVSVFVLQVLTGGFAHWTAKALVAAAIGAVWVTARAQWPSLPWNLIAARLHATEANGVPGDRQAK